MSAETVKFTGCKIIEEVVGSEPFKRFQVVARPCRHDVLIPIHLNATYK